LEVGFDGMTLVGIVIIILFYIDDIILRVRSLYDLEKQLKIIKDFFSSIGMTINIDKMKAMIIKSINNTYTNFVYGNNGLEEVTSYKYLIINIHHKLNWNYNIDKEINGEWKFFDGIENNCNLEYLWL
jgi:hypothetical protein